MRAVRWRPQGLHLQGEQAEAGARCAFLLGRVFTGVLVNAPGFVCADCTMFEPVVYESDEDRQEGAARIQNVASAGQEASAAAIPASANIFASLRSPSSSEGERSDDGGAASHEGDETLGAAWPDDVPITPLHTTTLQEAFDESPSWLSGFRRDDKDEHFAEMLSRDEERFAEMLSGRPRYEVASKPQLLLRSLVLS